MRYYIIAGERSGDLHGSNLVRAIQRYDPAATFRGIGGEYMKAAGVDLLLHYGKMAFMGFFEVFMNLRIIKQYIKMSRNDITAYEPDVVILIDYAGFNRQMAAYCKRHGIKVYYYISPKVWAWRQRRALQLKATVDHMFVILPFEKDFYKKFNWDVDYVGNPVLDAVKSFEADPNFLRKHRLDPGRQCIALLPGSRKQELERMLPLMMEVAARFPDKQFMVASVSNLDKSLYEPINALANVTLVEEDTYNLLSHAHSAVVTSGTATLETALFKVPQVVVYKTGQAGYAIAKWVVSVRFISLVNLVADRQVVKELIQDDANVTAVCDELRRLSEAGSYRDDVLKGYDEIYKTLDIGSASDNAAGLMTGYLRSGN